jgi:ketosteroid isomerase-like protein
MASANVELVRSIFRVWERGDYSWTDWAHPDIEFVFADGPTPGSWVGLDGLAVAWSDFLGVWKEFRSELDGLHELEGDRVVALAHYNGRGKASGVEIARISRGAGVFHFQAGRVKRLVFYFDRERALAEFGLASDDAPA